MSDEKKLEAKKLWGERPEIRQINTFFVVEHTSQFGFLQLKGIYGSFKDAMKAWNKFVAERKEQK